MDYFRLPAVTAITGYLSFIMILLSIVSGLSSDFPPLYAGLFAWLAALIMFHTFSLVLQLQILLLITLGLVGIAFSTPAIGNRSLITHALSINHSLLAMLAAVSFLRLITQPCSTDDENLPHGKRGFIRTILGVHFFGAIINLSAVLIVADRLSQRKPLKLFQGTTLSRGFSLAALWSPFFAAMGIALTNAPEANLLELSIRGFPVAMIGLLISSIGLKSAQKNAPVEGYPWQFKSLWLPGLLAIAIITAHTFFPLTPILTLITVFSLGITYISLTIRHGSNSLTYISDYITTGLPRILGELTLFMAAGILVVGISSQLDTYQYNLPPMQFGAIEASILLCGILILSIIGLHPLITISTAGVLLLPVELNPDLLGMTFLMGWALGVTASPLSAINLIMQSRYGLHSWQIIRSNFTYVSLMLIIDIIALNLYFNDY